MTCATCPKCGFDLERVEQLTVGHLSLIANAGLVLWRGHRVDLNAGEALIVSALARAVGCSIQHGTLAEVMGYEGDQPSGIMRVYIHRIRRKFRNVDPAFDMIDCGSRGARGNGVRWRLEAEE